MGWGKQVEEFSQMVPSEHAVSVEGSKERERLMVALNIVRMRERKVMKRFQSVRTIPAPGRYNISSLYIVVDCHEYDVQYNTIATMVE